ncbi:hypothetical protein ACFL9T_22500 [Thermodesulfobacteriota bacterium]
MGYGYADNERRDVAAATLAAGIVRDNEDDYEQWDVVLPINIAKGFTIYPTFAIFDEKDATIAGVKTDEGKSTIFGITWALFF